MNTNKVKKGMLITVKFDNGKKRSGVVTDVTENEITYRYFDESVEMIQSTSITREQIENGDASFVVAEHLGKEAKSESKSETKTENKSEKKPTFFASLESFGNIDQLIRAFKNEDPQTLALIASFLNPKSRVEFLYRLPDELFASVNNTLKNVSNINQEILAKIEAQLEEKFNRYKKEEKETKTTNGSPFDGGFDPFGGLLGGLLGGKGPEDLFKNFNPNDIKNIFGEAMKQESNQPPLPNPEQMRELFENMPKMLNELLGGLTNPTDDDDDDDFPRRPKF